MLTVAIEQAAPAAAAPEDARASLLGYWRTGRFGLLGEPLLLDLLQRAVVLQLGERLVDAVAERVALLEEHPEVLLAADRGELPDDGPVLDLLGADEEERGREVDDDAVDLLPVQGRDDVVRRVVDARLLVGLDGVLDVAEARRPDLGAELRVLQVGERGRVRDRRAVQPDERLVHVVVRVAEVDGHVALVGDRDLVDVEVEVLRAGPERVVERDDDPLHVVLG